MKDFLGAGLKDLEETEKYIGFSCIGRFTNAGPHKKGELPGRGCDWSLGGLFRLHTLEVEFEGERYPRFEVATPEEAQAHMKANLDAEKRPPCVGLSVCGGGCESCPSARD